MTFDLESTGLFRIKKHGHFLVMESTIFRNEEYPVFGLVEVKSGTDIIWAIIHIPSERAIISEFKTKHSAEVFFDTLSKMTDLNSLFLYNAKFASIEAEIKYDVEIAYRKCQSRR